MPFAFESARGRSNEETLADALAQHGPLALDLCLRYATDIAMALRELQQDGRSHGAVGPANVLLRHSGAALLPSRRQGYRDSLADLIGFGAVLYAMLTGKEPSGDQLRVVPAKPAVLKGPAAVRASATRLAERCLMAERETALDLQKILTEVRLLSVMAKQFSSDARSVHAPPPRPAPECPPPQPLAVYAGKVPPVINPPAVTPAPGAAAPALKHNATKPGENSPQTRRAKESDSRPVLKYVMCPKCKGYHVRLSRPRTRFERCLNLLGMGVHRCHRCFYRYIPFLGRKIARKVK